MKRIKDNNVIINVINAFENIFEVYVTPEICTSLVQYANDVLSDYTADKKYLDHLQGCIEAAEDYLTM